MPNEIHRELNAEGKKVVIVYDDGSRKTLESNIPQKPAGREFDADADEAQQSSHVFTPEELGEQ